MTKDYPKHIKRQLNDLSGEAYERELHRELEKLEKSFQEWRAGALSSGDLSLQIHQYEVGASRELYKYYNGVDHDKPVAYALVVGLLKPEEVPLEVQQAIQNAISFFQDMKDQNELRMPGE